MKWSWKNVFINFHVLILILSFNWAFIFHMTCCISHIYLSITNNYISQYGVLKSDSRVDGWKIQKKDKLFAITFSETDAARIRLYMNTLQVADLIFKPYHVRERIWGIGNWVLRRRKNGGPDGWWHFQFDGIYL